MNAQINIPSLNILHQSKKTYIKTDAYFFDLVYFNYDGLVNLKVGILNSVCLDRYLDFTSEETYIR